MVQPAAGEPAELEAKPWEEFDGKTFEFDTATIDKYALEPVAKE